MLLMLAPGDALGAGLSGPEVIARLKGRFGSLQSLSAGFEKSHYWKLADQTQSVRGRLWVQKPDKFRLDSPAQTIVSDGQTAWSYDPASGQVLVNSHDVVEQDRSHEKLLFDLILLGDPTARFEAEIRDDQKVGGRRCHTVELRARRAGDFIPSVLVWVDAADFLVRRIEYRTLNDDLTTYLLSGIRTDKTPDPKVFSFKPPPGADVVDMRTSPGKVTHAP
jgi:outer membrane lipoprotein carrier protein